MREIKALNSCYKKYIKYNLSIQLNVNSKSPKKYFIITEDSLKKYLSIQLIIQSGGLLSNQALKRTYLSIAPMVNSRSIKEMSIIKLNKGK